MTPTERERPDRGELLALAAILLVALGLRAWGAGWGLPFTYHPDEHQYVDSAVAMLSGDLDPGRFNNPTGLKYALAGIYGGAYAIGRATGRWADAAAFQDAFAADPSGATLGARLFVALLGVATVLAAWALAREAWGRRSALLAAALLAGTFLHARDAHYAVSDVPATLLTTLCLWQALRLLRLGRARDLWLGAALVGLAAATKYSALAVVLPLGLAWLWADEPRDAPLALDRAWLRRMAARLLDARVLAAALLAAATFLLVVPYAVLSPEAFLADLATLSERGREGFKGLEIDPRPGWLFYLDALRWGMGLPLLLTSIAGLGLALWRRRPAEILVALFPLLLWAYLGRQLLMFARFMIPALPPLCALAGAAIDAGVGALAGRRPSLTPRADALAGLLAGLVLLPSLLATVRHDLILGREDTRTEAKRWIEDRVPEGSRILYQSNGPELASVDGERDAPLTRRRYALERLGTLDLPERPLADWRAEGWELLVVSSFSSDRRLLDPAEDAAYRAWYADADATLERLATFQPYEGTEKPPFVFAQLYGPATDLHRFTRPGPEIRIYRLSPAAP